MRRPEDIEEICRKLQPILGNPATALWHAFLASDNLGREDLGLDIELLAERLLRDQPLADQPVLLPPPPLVRSNGRFLLGKLVYKDKALSGLYLHPEDFIKQVGIFAVTGEGKTNLAYLLALQLLNNQIPFLGIDWKRSWRALRSLPQGRSIRVVTVGRDVCPFYWNPFRPPPGADPDLWVGTVAEVLEKSHLSGPGVAFFIAKIFPKLLRRGDAEFYPNFHDGLRELEGLKVRERELRWKQTAQRIFQTFTAGNARPAFNSRNPVKLEELLDKPVILELDLELPKPLRIFFSELVLRWIHLYRLSQGETESLRHVLFLEEVHNLFSQGYFREVPSTNLENVYREIRAFGQGLVSITQHPSMLPVYLLGNCHTQVYMGLQHEDDIRAARKALFLRQQEQEYLDKLEIGQAIVKIKHRVQPCLVSVPLVPVEKGIATDNWLKANSLRDLPKQPLEDYEEPPSDLPAHNTDTRERQKSRTKEPNAGTDQQRLLSDVLHNPLVSITDRYRRLALNPKYGNRSKNVLIANGYLQPRRVTTGTGSLVLLELTGKGRMLLRDLGHHVPEQREGVVHRFWKERIATRLKQQGYSVLVEQWINGRPDITADKSGERIAVEIETGKSYAIRNINRDLEAGFQCVLSVATSPATKKQIESRLRGGGSIDTRVAILQAQRFEREFSARIKSPAN